MPEEFESRYAQVEDDNRRKLLGMTAALDDAFANVTRALSTAGLLNDSIIVFTSDVRSPSVNSQTIWCSVKSYDYSYNVF